LQAQNGTPFGAVDFGRFNLELYNLRVQFSDLDNPAIGRVGAIWQATVQRVVSTLR
jgi:hypothetical protein